MLQWRSARRTSREKEGTWQEKVPSSAGEGRETAFHLHTHSHLTHTLCHLSAVRSCFTHTAPLLLGPKASHPHSTHPPSLPLIHPTPPTHVDAHPQYAVGGPVLVQWVPTSHFGLQVEQEVIRKPEDQQWITVTANNGLKHIPCTIKHIQTNSVGSHNVVCSTRTQHTHTHTHTSQHHTHLHSCSHLDMMLMGGPVVFPGACGGCPSPAPPPAAAAVRLAVVEAPRVSGG